MQESTELFKHSETGQIYAIRRRWDGELVGSAGPLDDIKDADSIPVTPERNDWIRENGQDLILVDSPATN